MTILEGSILWGCRWDATVEANGKGTVKTMPPSAPEGLLEMHRPAHTELAVDAHVAQWAIRLLTRVMALFAIAIGAAILIGGSDRFAGLSYEAALSTPGAPASWGVTILAAGLATMTGTFLGRPRVVAGGAFLGALWSLLFASAFAIAACRYDEANTTAMWVYLTLAVIYSTLAGVHCCAARIKR